LDGNVGSGAISHLVLRKTQLSGGVIQVHNPLAARGGTAPEPIAEVKLFAPHTFRKKLQRAIIADDYAAIVQREFKDKVQRAAARLRWTGSWYEMLVAVDPYGAEEADAELLDEITKRLHRYRRIGHDLVVKSARRVPLDIEILICVLPSYLRGHVKTGLLDLFSNRLLSNGQHGFFHVDNLTFGDDIHLSQLVSIAQAVEGVESVQMKKLQRLNEQPNSEIENGVLPLGPFEIARLDNNPSLPENGKLTLDMRGGR
jgi:predicted phage baseplate assembly protein